MPGETQINERDERFLVPSFRDLFGRERNENGVVLAGKLNRARDGIGRVNGVGIGEEKPSAGLGLNADPDSIIFADPALG